MKLKACVKAIIKENGYLLVVQRSNYDEIGPGEWEFPGGTIEIDETPEQTLYREVWEEIGLIVRSSKLAYISTAYIDEKYKLLVINYQIDVSGKIRLSEEHTQYRWVDDSEAKKLLMPAIYNDYIKYVKGDNCER